MLALAVAQVAVSSVVAPPAADPSSDLSAPFPFPFGSGFSGFLFPLSGGPIPPSFIVIAPESGGGGGESFEEDGLGGCFEFGGKADDADEAEAAEGGVAGQSRSRHLHRPPLLSAQRRHFALVQLDHHRRPDSATATVISGFCHQLPRDRGCHQQQQKLKDVDRRSVVPVVLQMLLSTTQKPNKNKLPHVHANINQ